MSKANHIPRYEEARSGNTEESSTAGMEDDLYEAFRIYAAETGADRELDFDPEQDFDVWHERRVKAAALAVNGVTP